MPAGTRVQSPAASTLARAGVPQGQVAERIGRDPVTVSRQLSGHIRLRSATLDAIRQLAGDDVADEIAALRGVDPATTTPPPVPYSPATSVLARAGVSQPQVAERIGRSRATVSHQLSGRARLRSATLDAIRQLAGDDVADEIAALRGVDPATMAATDYPFSPAASVLARAGIRQRQVAERIGRSPQAVSAQLAGRAGLQPATLDAIRQLAGDDVADEIAALRSDDADLPFSPAASVLSHAGIRQRQVAERIGRNPQTVSAQLAGDTRLQPATLDAIRQLAGDDVADEIAALRSDDADLPFSPAASVLSHAGIRQRQVAERIGRNPQTVSRQLAGDTRLQPATLDAIRQLAGDDVADEIAALRSDDPIEAADA